MPAVGRPWPSDDNDDDNDDDGDGGDSDDNALRKKLHLLFQGEKAFMGRRAGRLQWWTGRC